MNTSSRSCWALCLATGLLLAACGERTAEAPPTAAPAVAPSAAPSAAPPTAPPTAPSTAPSASPSAAPPAAEAARPAAPSTDQWLGQWNGPEGTFLRLTGGQGHYEVTVQNLDGPRTFAGSAVGDTIEFQRDGQTQTLRASNGEQTGMKWLAGKKDCLTVRAGEGYCRD